MFYAGNSQVHVNNSIVVHYYGRQAILSVETKRFFGQNRALKSVL